MGIPSSIRNSIWPIIIGNKLDLTAKLQNNDLSAKSDDILNQYYNENIHQNQQQNDIKQQSYSNKGYLFYQYLSKMETDINNIISKFNYID